MIKAAQYLRMSTDKQRYSIDSQRAAIAEYAAVEGFEIVRTYADEARSGVTIAGRDGLQDLLRDVLSGAPFAAILVLDVSRWGRYQNPDQAAHYEFICYEAGVAVRYCADGITHDGSATSSLLKSIKRVMAGEYSRQLSDRCRSGIRRHVTSGAKHGGVAPYGFARQIFAADGSAGRVLSYGERRGPNQIVRLVRGPPDEADTMRLVFRLFVAEKMGPAPIARRLNTVGITYRDQTPWSAERVRRVLRNEAAVGRFVFNRTHCRFGDRRPLPRSEWMRVEVATPIVSQRLFQAAQARLRALSGGVQTDEEMIGRLRSLLGKRGFLTPRLLDRTSGISGSRAYERRFGSIEAAWSLVPYDGDIPRRRRLERAARQPEVIVQKLRAILDEKGYLSYAEIKRCSDLPSPKTIAKYLGSLAEAYRLAGYERSQGELVSAGRRRGLEARRAKSLSVSTLG